VQGQGTHVGTGLPARVRISVLPSASSRFVYELLGGVRLGFLVGFPFRMARQFLRLFEAEAEVHPAGYGVVTDHIFLFSCTMNPDYKE
jgi:NhaP-type Na+/H+ or K+/H+ antiporter